MKPKLYYRVEENGVPFDNFCSDAAIGAHDAGIECIPFSDIKQVNMNPYNIVVTTVEELAGSNPAIPTIRVRNSGVEFHSDEMAVDGSIPSVPTNVAHKP